jgi:hypothetical protein
MEILQQTFLDNSYQAWLLAIALGVFAAVALRALQAIVKQRLSKLAARTETHWDDYAAEMIARTKWLFLLIFGAFAGSLLLDLPSSAHNAFRVAFAIGFFIQAGIWAGVLLQAVLTQSRKERLKENPADTTTLGSVERVGLKTTRLRSLSGEQLVFSNTDLLGSRVRNFGRMYERRVVFNIGVTYQTPR